MRVILGVDDSTCSDAAVRYVTQAVWPKGTSFLVISAAAPILVGVGEVLAPQAIIDVVEGQQKYHREIAERATLRLRKAGLTVKARMEQADPRVALEEAARAERADLVVVGSHGRTGIKRLVLGRVASHIVAHAPCAVLVVKEQSLSQRETGRAVSNSETLPV